MAGQSTRSLTRSERRAKGVNLIPLLKILAGNKGAWPADKLSDAARELVGQRAIASAWYPFEAFEEILCLVHEVLFDATDEAAVNMGVIGGTTTFEGVYKSFVHDGDAIRTLEGFGRMWERYFNFGAARIEPRDRGVELIVDGYPDMCRCHGHIIVGYALALLKLSGTSGRRHTILEAPWDGGQCLRIALTFSHAG